MADDFQLGSGNWWDASRSRFERGSAQNSAITTTLNSVAAFGWAPEMVEEKARSSVDTGTVSGGSIVLQGHDQSSGGGGLLADPNMHMMGLGLSSQAMDWNHQPLFHGEKADSSFRPMLHEDMSSSSSFQQETGTASSQDHWREKMYSASSEESNVNDYKQINRPVFSLEQPQFSSKDHSSGESTTTGLATGFQVDSAAAAYGLLLADNQPPHSAYENRPLNFPYPMNYGSQTGEWGPNSWNKFPQTFLRPPISPKQPPPNQLHFANKTPFWNATGGADEVRPSFFSPLPSPLPVQALDEKPKQNLSEVRDSSSMAKKTSTPISNKRPRNETPSPLPSFKVRKEKMGDRITALQQLVSPFGKTDTASVLSEAIEYIKFLHEQVSVLSNPYMKSGTSIQPQQQTSDKSKVADQAPRQDLRSRGLCLVPVSSTYPVTHDTTVEFWTPTFGGTFR